MAERHPGPWRQGVPNPSQHPNRPAQAFHKGRPRILEDFYTNFDLWPLSVFEERFHPRIDMHEDERAILITAELPGMEEQEIEIILSRDTLTIKGEKREECQDRQRETYCMERSYGSFQRLLRLPAEVNADESSAVFRNGVLSVTLPKVEPASQSPRKITIRTG